MGEPREIVKEGLAGAAAGFVATGAMSAVMLAAERAGFMSELPPHVIAEETIEASGARDDVDHTSREALGWALHFGFGAAAGAIFGVARRVLHPPVPDVLHGAAFAMGVWALSYKGWIPAMRFLPPPEHDEEGRPPSMIAAHLVYGALMGLIVEQLRMGRVERLRRDAADVLGA